VRRYSRRTYLEIAAALAVVVALGIWWATTRHTATPRITEGWAMPNGNGTAIWLYDTADGPGEGYVIAGVLWSGPDNAWHHGDTPTCVGTDTTSKTHVQLGVIDVESQYVSYAQVAWLRCLE
jgi:hypothetical protein